MLRKFHKFGWTFFAAFSLLASAAGFADAHGDKTSKVPLPKHKAFKGEKCVEPTDVMREQHMEFILHQRDETMHNGIRTTKHSLKNCVNCHADPKTKSVLGKDGFCESCHSYAAVSMDCFSCHTHKASDKNAIRSDMGSLGKHVIANTGGAK